VTVSVTGVTLNVAVTSVAPLTVTVQPAVPAQAPLQPAKVEPALAVAASVNGVPGVTVSVQSAPQLMPAGALDTLPEPLPFRVTVKVTGAGVVLKVAVTAVAAFTVTVQPAVPAQAPPQPTNVEPAAGVAVSVNGVPGVTVSVQSLPQLMPAGVLDTVPAPVPLRVTVRATGADVAVPLTARETVSPPAMTFTLVANVLTAVGAKRMVTTWLAPAASDQEPPDTTLNGALTLTVPDRLAWPTFCTVNVRVAVVPTVMLPKLVAAVGVTVKSTWATPLVDAEHPLSLPTVSTAVTRAK
jgi:hypothetical protein